MSSKQINTLIKQLKEKKLTLALAESVTCGLAAHKLSTSPGTSEVFAGSVVCYSPVVKNCLMGIAQKKIDRFTCESKEITEALAKNLKKIMDADIHAAVTGLASAGGSETKEKPVGTVFFSVLYKNKMHHDRQVFKGTPLAVREKACKHLYDLVLLTVNKK